MKKVLLAGAVSTLVLTGCSGAENETTEAMTTMDIAEAPPSYSIAEEAMEAPPPPPPISTSRSQTDAEAISGAGEIPVGMPQVAYRYAYGFRLPSDAIRPLQERHADMCEAKGPDVCRIISMDQAENEGDYAYGNLTLAVRARDARTFGKELANASGKVDGELVSSSIEGEDLSKRIVDTEARLRARTVLRDRLMEVLRTRKGSVQELVEAERGVAHEVAQQVRVGHGGRDLAALGPLGEAHEHRRVWQRQRPPAPDPPLGDAAAEGPAALDHVLELGAALVRTEIGGPVALEG